MKKAINPKEFDKKVRPVDDFFAYVNDTWLRKTPIPASESVWGSFDVLIEENKARLHRILEELKKDKNIKSGSEQQKLREYYRSGMDEKAIEQAGIEPIRKYLDKIENIKSKNDLVEVFGELSRDGAGGFFGMMIEQDEKNVEEMALHFWQGGLGLPDRDYYFKKGQASDLIRKKYQKYITNIFMLLGEKKKIAQENAQGIFRFEQRLAKACRERQDLRDNEKNYHKMTFKKFESLCKSWNWNKYFATAGIPRMKHVLVGQPEFYEAFDAAFQKTNLSNLKAYMMFHIVAGIAGKLTQKFIDESFAFSQVFSGAKEQRPRWKRVLSEIDDAMGEALGKIYVEKYFPPESKARVKKMVEFIRKAFAERIKNLDWMTPATKKYALEKLKKIDPKIGYPDKWEDYRKLKILPDATYVENHIAACRYEWERTIKKLGKKVDKGEWEMTPPTVNAYFHPTMQQIVFPAGILQPPYFFADADDAVNYGAIGSVIGHELTHGFDDQGRKFDAKGNMKNWWNKKDHEHFILHANNLAEQFSKYEPIKGHFINGKLTLGENIADLGGLVIAYHAFKKSLKGKKTKKIDGLTPEERFFIAWAQSEKRKARPELLKMVLVVDPHSPSKFRVNGPASNMEEFYEVFGVKEGDKLFRKDPVKIW